jgi:hypothetical protein
MGKLVRTARRKLPCRDCSFDSFPNGWGSQQAVRLQEMAHFHKCAVNDRILDDRPEQRRLRFLAFRKVIRARGLRLRECEV